MPLYYRHQFLFLNIALVLSWSPLPFHTQKYNKNKTIKKKNKNHFVTDIMIICHSQAISVPPAIDIYSCSCPDHLAYHAISVYPCLREKINERKIKK